MSRIRERRGPGIVVILAACMLALPGCDTIIDTNRASVTTGRVTVTGQSPVPMRLITSTDFNAFTDSQGGIFVELVRADTATTELPYDRSFQFGTTDRFIARLRNADEASTASVEMRVYLDGTERYRQAATMTNSSIEFIFYFTLR